MASRTLAVTPRIHAYMMEVALRDSPLLADLRHETEKIEFAGIQISPEQGQFLALLVEILGARRYLEIGTFTGYSSLSVALALPPGRARDGAGQKAANGPTWRNAIGAARAWIPKSSCAWARRRARSTTCSPPATQAVATWRSSTRTKVNYDAYYERCLKLPRPGGVVAIDNVLWGGAVAEPGQNDEDTVAIRELNRKIRDDKRVTCSLVPISDGLMLCRRR